MTGLPKKPRSKAAWRDDFERAYDEGLYQDAAEIYDGSARKCEPLDLVLKAARAHRQCGRPAAALGLLMGLRIPASRPRDRVKRDAFLGELYARTQDLASADQLLSAALKTAQLLDDGDLVAYVGRHVVNRHLLEQNTERARQALELIKSGSSRHWRTRALIIEAYVLQYEGRVFEQAQCLLGALRLLRPNRDEDVELGRPSIEELITDREWRTAITLSLAELSRELYIPEATAEVEHELSGAPWPKGSFYNRFFALSLLAWGKAFHGDYFSAFRHLKSASEAAETTALKVIAACDRSFIAHYFGERRWSRVELDEAERLAKEVDWQETVGEERAGLLMLAELFCGVDPARASMYLAQYRNLGAVRLPVYPHDVRVQASVKYATGLVELATGNRARGLADVREARAIYERVGYDFRVAECLMSEYRVTANRDLLPMIEEKLRHYPLSWLADELRAATERPMTVLSPMQQSVFEELCLGKSTAEIAQSLRRSEYTISNHIKEIFKAYGVRTRAALLAKAASKGLVGGK